MPVRRLIDVVPELVVRTNSDRCDDARLSAGLERKTNLGRRNPYHNPGAAFGARLGANLDRSSRGSSVLSASPYCFLDRIQTLVRVAASLPSRQLRSSLFDSGSDAECSPTVVASQLLGGCRSLLV